MTERLPRDPLKREAATKGAEPEAASRPFIHLRVHSAYSLLEGALPVGKIVGHAVKDRSPAIAITDTNNLFGALEFAQKATKEGVQPIVGCQLDVFFNDEEPDTSRQGRKQGPTYHQLILIAATETGYANLVRLVSRSYLNHPDAVAPHVLIPWVRELAQDVICLTGGPSGAIGAMLSSDKRHLAESRIDQLHEIFGDRLYVELQRYEGHDKRVEAGLIDLAYTRDLPLVATNEAFFPSRDDYDAHDALVAISEGSVVAEDNRRRLTPDHFLKSQAEMDRLFSEDRKSVV